MPSIPALVEPSVLAWARRSANLEPIAAARKIGVDQDRLHEWERG
ncbi:MAG: helix-turn-helix domain-containing protein [Propionibacteriaceae bacterium]